MAKKVTMQMIADQVGVSVTTVSHVFNHSRFVAFDLRQRILDCAEKLGYTQKHSIQRTRNKANAHIGLIVSDIRDADLFLDIIKISESVAREFGYTILVGDAENSREKEEELVRNFLAKKVHGLLIASNFHTADTLEKIEGFKNLPVVLIDRKWEDKRYDFVGIDNFRTSFDLTRDMLKKGAASIGFLGLKIDGSTMLERERGCRMGMLSEERGSAYNSCSLDLLGDAQKQILDFCFDRQKKGKSTSYHSKYDVIFCFNSNVCYELLSTLKQERLRSVDFKIVTYDDSIWLDFLPIPLTVIRQPATEISITAVNLLMEKIQSAKVHEVGKEVHLPIEVIDKNPWLIN